MKKLTTLMVLCFIAFAFMAVTYPSKAICAEPIVLKWASYLPRNNPETVALQKFFFDRINERAKGELVIEYRGGPETIPGQGLGSAVHKGVVDIAQIIIGFYEAIVHGVNALMLTELTPQEERISGTHDFIVQLHKENGLMFLGRGSPSEERFFYTFLNKRVEKPEDFSKLRIGSGTAARAATIAWGAKVIPVRGVGDYYTSMERGLYDGVSSCPLPTWVALGCHEVTKYIIDHPYYKSTIGVIMNLDSWNRLPKHLQNLMTETMIEYPRYYAEMHTKEFAKARKLAEDAGVEFYKLKPDVADWFIKTAYDAAWEYQQKRFPEVTLKLKKVLTK